MTAGSPLVATLNSAQQHAVEVPGGPLLILAGPGSGKTRVIAHRIAYLVRELRVPPWRVLAVTFTNKAASEMRERVEALLGDDARDLTMGTFHAICARILRRDGEGVGLPPDFAIYDTDDQRALVKRIERDLHIDEKRFPPRAVMSAISSAKNERVTASGYLQGAGSYFEEVVGRVYEQYQVALDRNCAVDFDDLLGRVLTLFEQVPEARDRYAERYLHVLVDEFQDTNVVQYRLARDLASIHGNITAVGDPDQSIYSWRAADVRNLQYFERDFPGTEIVLLEQNYRSTGHILRAAHAVIARDGGRRERALWTDNPDGQPVVARELHDGEEEGVFIAREVLRLMADEGRRPAECAVMYRTNAQSRAIEEAFVEQGIRYRIVGGTRFYDRREVRDLLAYLRLAHNEADSVAFERIVNVPPRGIGGRTVGELHRAAGELGISPFAVAARVAQDSGVRGNEDPALPRLRADIRTALGEFVALMDRLREQRGAGSVSALLDVVLAETRYHQHLERSDEEHAETRWENVQELRSVAAQYEELEGEASLTSFLEELALVADVDDPDSDVPDAVTLTTLHAAKGLEYPVVFMSGMEEGVLPHFRSLDDPAQMEEERRVCYVGMTRAMERLYLLHASRRLLMGSYRSNPLSRFVRDVPAAELATVREAHPRGGTPGPRERRAALATRAAAPADAAPMPAFSTGERVHHARFGAGMVVSTQPAADDVQVVVAFEDAGVKKLLASLAGLTRDGSDPEGGTVSDAADEQA